MSAGVTLYVEGIGMLGPGMPSWQSALPILRGERPHVFAPTELVSPQRLPPAERRRAGAVVRLAVTVADAAIAQAAADPSSLASIFSSSGGEGANCHSICEEMACPKPILSPTRFTNSVYNAASGYWHIAVASHRPSTSVCAHDGSLCAGLMEAATTVVATEQPVLLVCYDLPYPEPLNSRRTILENFGVAFVLSPHPTVLSQFKLQLQPMAARAAPATRCDDPSLEALRHGIPAAAALPLLQVMARRRPATVTLKYFDELSLRVEVAVHTAPSTPRDLCASEPLERQAHDFPR